MSFEGADVDGLDRVAKDCQEAAQVCDEVRAALEIIVAASWCFGPFGAAFTSYLKTVVIPWLQKVSQALQLFARVLTAHANSQRNASSAATSLPDYVTPALPSSTTADYPVMRAIPSAPTSTATHEDSYLFGLVTVGTDTAGRVVDVAVGGSSRLLADEAHLHLDRDAAGDVVAATTTAHQRLGSATDPLLAGSQTLSAHQGVSAVADGSEATGSVDATDSASVLGVPLARGSAHVDATVRYDADGTVTDGQLARSADLVLGPGTGQGATPAGSLPGGGQLPSLPGTHPGLTYKPPEIAVASSDSWGTHFGTSHGESALVRVAGVEYGGNGQDGALHAGNSLGGDISAHYGFFEGRQTLHGYQTEGVFVDGDIGASVSEHAGAQLGSEHAYGEVDGSIAGGFGVGGTAYLIEHGPLANPGYDAGASFNIKDVEGAQGAIHLHYDDPNNSHPNSPAGH